MISKIPKNQSLQFLQSLQSLRLQLSVVTVLQPLLKFLGLLAPAISSGDVLNHGNTFWLVVDLPRWKMMEFVTWDDENPNIWKNKIHVPNHQPVMIIHKSEMLCPFSNDSAKEKQWSWWGRPVKMWPDTLPGFTTCKRFAVCIFADGWPDAGI